MAIEGTLADNLIGIPDGWVLRWSVPHTGCDGVLAAWYLTATARDGEEAYAFTFDRSGTRAALLAAYGNGREPNLLAQRSGENGGTPVEIALPGTSCTPQSATVLLGVATFPWGTAPTGLVRQAGISGVVVYDAINEGPNIPPITVEIEDTFSCFNVAEFRIDL